MLRFVEGFDTYTTNAQLLRKWSTASNVVPAAGGRNGTQGANFGAAERASLVLDSQGSWYVGFSWRITAYPDLSFGVIAEWYDGASVQARLTMTAAGLLQLHRDNTVVATSTRVYPLGVDHYVEWQYVVDNTTGILEVRVDETVWATFSGDTQATANATASTFWLGSFDRLAISAGQFAGQMVDDLYICDGQGSANNSYRGDSRVCALFPSAAGDSSQFTPSAGANYAAVDETSPDDDTTYVQSGTTDHLDLYQYADLPAGLSVVHGVQALACANKQDAGARNLALVVKSGATTSAGTDQGVGTTYGYYRRVLDTNPDGSVAWTPTTVNAAQAGPKVR